MLHTREDFDISTTTFAGFCLLSEKSLSVFSKGNVKSAMALQSVSKRFGYLVSLSLINICNVFMVLG